MERFSPTTFFKHRTLIPISETERSTLTDNNFEETLMLDDYMSFLSSLTNTTICWRIR